MTLRSNTRTISHLAIVAMIALLAWLSWRLDYDLGWLLGSEPEPMFAPGDLPPLVAPEEAQEPTEELPETAEESPESAAPSAPALEPAASSPQEAADPAAEALFKAWAQARRLLRQRDLVGAEAAYLELTRRWPRHPDLAGELGNVYVLLEEQASARTAFRRAQELLEPMGPSSQLQAVTRWLKQDD